MKTIAWVILASLQLVLSAQTFITDDTISGTWTKANSPYLIMNDVLVTNLVIEPGVDVIFTHYFRFNVRDTLWALGAYNDSIRFTVLDTTGYYNGTHTGWAGIGDVYDDVDIKISMQFCVVQFSKNAAIQTYGAFSISDSRIQYNSEGIKSIMVFGDTRLIERSVIQGNNGYGIYLDLGFPNATHINNCNILNNNGDGLYCAVYSYLISKVA